MQGDFILIREETLLNNCTETAEHFIRSRITQLRIQRGVSEYGLSYALGHSRGYIHNISSGKTLPSMLEFLNICDYFGITPVEFFDMGVEMPELCHESRELFPKLDADSQRLVMELMRKLYSCP